MTLTIELSPEIEQRLRRQAAASGQQISRIVEQIVERAMGNGTEGQSSRETNPQRLKAKAAELILQAQQVAAEVDERQRAAVRDFLRRVDQLRPDPNRPKLTGLKAEVEQLIVDRFEQGRGHQ